MGSTLPNKADIMEQIRKRNGKRKWVPKYGLTAIPKLMKMSYKLNPLRSLEKWPNEYRNALQIDSTFWNQIIYSLITPDEEKNMTTVNNATAIFDILFKQFGNKDLWVSLCENISDIIKEESQYQNIIEVVLLAALHEKDGIHSRIAEMSSFLSENPWFIMCKNIMPLVADEYQKCYLVLLFLSLSGQQKVFLLNYLTGNTEEMVQTNKIENIFSLLFMTNERWVNLIQVIELLKQKRQILRMLSIDDKCHKPDTLKPDIKLSDEVNAEISVLKHSIYQNSNVDVEEPHIKSENSKENSNDGRIKVKQEENSNVERIKVKQEENSVIQPDITQVEPKEPKQVTQMSAIAPNSELIKQEDLILENIQIKEEKVEEIEISPATLSKLVEIKAENVCEDSNEEVVIIDEYNEKEQLSLDKLILDYSIQQINKASSKVTINVECINIFSEDDDDDDHDVCFIQEDNKLEVAQLLNMYHEIVLPEKMVKNPLAAENIKKVDKGSHVEEHHDFVRIPSTSSIVSSKPSKMLNATMSSHKKQNKIKKNRSKTNASVRKLFEQLRNESQACSSTAENTIIVLDKTLTPKKRKNSPTKGCTSKRKRYFNKDIPHDCTPVNLAEEQEIQQITPRKNSPIHCSTPIIKNRVNEDFIPIISKNTKSNNSTSAAQNLNDEITDLTKEINYDSLITVDLTTESLNCSSVSKIQNTVIDLDNTADNNKADCSIVSVSNSNLSLSGESDVTVLNISQNKKERQMRKFAKGISKLDASEKGRLLELITQNIFSGCNVLDRKKRSVHNVPGDTTTRATETAEDTYIKEVIVGQTASRNSIGSNIYNPEKDAKNKTGLRMVVIDGSNVAMEHARGKDFSVKGLKICIDYFLKRGHVVKAFVPRFRCKYGKSTDPRLLDDLERRGLVVYTPSREIQGRNVVSYDDRYIVQCAAEFDGVIVSGDNYRDLMRENPRWRFVIENRLLQFTWVQDMIMFPRDPLGRNGPSLEQFLRHPEPNRQIL